MEKIKMLQEELRGNEKLEESQLLVAKLNSELEGDNRNSKN